MNKSQLNAIAYAYKRRQEAENDKKLKDLGLYEVFENQDIYSNKIFFIRAVVDNTKKARKAIIQGLQKLSTAALSGYNYGEVAGDRVFKKYTEIIHIVCESYNIDINEIFGKKAHCIKKSL